MTSATATVAVIAAAITSQTDKNKLPTHVRLDCKRCGLSRDSIVLLEQIRTIDKRRLREKMGSLGCRCNVAGQQSLSISFGLGKNR